MKEKLCDKKMTFQECELAILRTAVDKAEEISGKREVSSPDIKKMTTILENFLRRKKLVCYGGIAINSILPKEDQFYNKDVEIPDYDFYSPNALHDAKELADIYINNGFDEVEAKSGQHHGTYKVFVNFIGIADITFLQKDIFEAVKGDSIRVADILYAPPNFLRMSMYLELSRPAGDVSRWEKVLKRLTLLNKSYPLKPGHCETADFQRDMEDKDNEDLIYDTVRNTLINLGVVFFGGYAISMYSQYMPAKIKKRIKKIPDFDVLSEEAETAAVILKERLEDVGIKKVKVVKHGAIGEIIAPHYQILVGKDTVAFIYKPIACHSYNVIRFNKQKLQVATIDTMLSFYLAFMYSAREYYDVDRIVCMSQYLFEVQQKNRLKQKGLLKRFSINCYGHQETLEEMRSKKAEKFKEFKALKALDKSKSKEYEEWFLRYIPKKKEENAIDVKEEVEGERNREVDNKKIPIVNKTFRKKYRKRRKIVTKRRGRGGILY
jgi:Poly(A) polymerase catalytic subunit